MADSAAFEKQILIALEATISGMQETIRALTEMRKHLDQVTSSTGSLDKATASLSGTYAKASKDVVKLGSNFKSLKKVQKGMYETMRSIGNVTRTALGTATVAATALIVETKRIGDTMLHFQVSSLNAAKSLYTLTDAYGELTNQADLSILSMQDVAAEITKFQKQGIAQMSATMQKEFISGWKGIQSVITAVVGKTSASETMHAWVGSLQDEFKFLKKTIAEELGPIAQDIQAATSPEFADIKVQNIDLAITKLEDLRERTGDLGGVTQQIIGHMNTLKDVALGRASPLVAGTVAINNAMSFFGTTLENVSTQLVKTFGPELGAIIRSVGKFLENNVAQVVAQLIDKAVELRDRFREWGGTAKLMEELSRAMNYAWKIISKITSAGLGFVEWITEANVATQVLVAGLASLVLAPGLITGMSTVIMGLGGITKSAYGAATAIRAMSFAQMAGQARMLAGSVGAVGAAATVGHLGGKALGGALGLEAGSFGDAVSGAAGAALAGAMIGSIVPGIGTAVGAAIGGVGSLIVTAIGSWGDDTEDAINKIPPIPDVVTKEMTRMRKLEKMIQTEKLEKLAEKVKKVGKEAEETGDKFAGFVSRMEELAQLGKRILPGFSQAIGGISAIIDTLGPTTDQFGESISNLVKRTAMDEMSNGFDAIQKYAKVAAEIINSIDLARAQGNTEDIEQHTRLLGIALLDVDKATKNLEQSLEASLRPLEKQLELIGSIKDLRQLDLDIAQQIYGTPALAVQAQLELVKIMQMEKETLEAQLATTQSIIDHQLAQGIAEKDILFLRMRELDIGKKIKGVTRDQLKQVKELRDGYLDAVQAQALGAGIFSKILITQEQNIGRGLIKKAVKPNFLLGQVGVAAGAAKADPYRFSAQGQGYLETLGGQIMTPEDISKAVSERVSNISDPMAADAAAQSAAIFTNIMGGADKNTRDLGNIFMLGSDRQVDAINALAEKLHPASATAAALTGTAAGGTMMGAAAQRNGRGLALPPLTNADYLKQAQQQGSAVSSIEALMKYRQTARASGTSGIESDMQGLFSSMVKSFNLQMEISSTPEGSPQSKSLEAELDKIEEVKDRLARVLKYKHGNESVEKVQSRFDQAGVELSAKRVGMLDDQIGKLLEGNAAGQPTTQSPEVKAKLEKLRQEKAGVIEDVGLRPSDFISAGKVNEAREADMIEKVRNTNESQMKKIQHLKKTAPPETEQMIQRYQKSHPALGGIPTLTAVDTDEFMGRITKGSSGGRSSPMTRKLEAISGLDEKIKKISGKIDPGGWKGFPYESTGTNEMGPTSREQNKQEIKRKQQDRYRHSKAVLERARKAQYDALDKSRESMSGPQRGQIERSKAIAAFGTGYTGDAIGRLKLDDMGRRIRPGGPQTPNEVRGGNLPIKARTGIGDPGKVRGLSHGSSGSWQNKGKGVRQMLQQVGLIMEEMGNEMDQYNEDQNNITIKARTHLSGVQAVSP